MRRERHGAPHAFCSRCCSLGTVCAHHGPGARLNHGVNVRNECRRFFDFIANWTQGERDHSGVVEDFTVFLQPGWYAVKDTSPEHSDGPMCLSVSHSLAGASR